MSARQQILATFTSGSDIHGATRAMLMAAADVYAPVDGPSTGCLLVGTALPACTQHETIQKTLTEFLTTLAADLAGQVSDRFAKETKRLRRTPSSIALQVTSLLVTLAVHARTGTTRRKLRALASDLADTFASS